MRILIGIIAVVALTIGALAAPAPASANVEHVNVDEDGVAIEGYDPVAYFELGRPTKGRPSLEARHAGATYRFVSERHLDLFRADPEKYVPAYGGYCSYGMRFGQTSKIDPMTWAIHDGRLYLQLNLGTKAVWMTNVGENISIADELWLRLYGRN